MIIYQRTNTLIGMFQGGILRFWKNPNRKATVGRVLYRGQPDSGEMLSLLIIKHCWHSQEVNRGFWSCNDKDLWEAASRLYPDIFKHHHFFLSRHHEDSVK
jgi:hypothetical protein